jgi:glutamate-1-semialdehyde 2,1-aminomutase
MSVIAPPKKRLKSETSFEQALQVIPGGVNSPMRACKGILSPPMVVESGYLDQITDLDGHKYIDFCGSWGALIHGHCHPRIVEVAQKQVAKGSTFGITTQYEELLARKIVSHIDQVDKVRFVSTGTEATMTAIRLARGFTGRDLIIKFAGHYHGHADMLLVQAGSGVATLNPASSSLGVPADAVKHTIVLPFNDFDAFKQLLHQPEIKKNLACVILEPIAANMGIVTPLPGYLEMLREETAKIGALLIFDEVITGFRVGLKGAAHRFGIKPDLLTFGKVIGGGYPAAAFGGRAEIMNCLAPLGGVYQAGTLSGNPVAMVAGLEAITMLEDPLFYSRLEEKTNLITHPVREIIQRRGLNLCLTQVGSLFTIFFGIKEAHNFADVKKCNLEQFAEFFQFLFERGIYPSPSQFEAHFISNAHTYAHLTYMRDVILEFLESEC